MMLHASRAYVYLRIMPNNVEHKFTCSSLSCRRPVRKGAVVAQKKFFFPSPKVIHLLSWNTPIWPHFQKPAHVTRTHRVRPQSQKKINLRDVLLQKTVCRDKQTWLQ